MTRKQGRLFRGGLTVRRVAAILKNFELFQKRSQEREPYLVPVLGGALGLQGDGPFATWLAECVAASRKAKGLRNTRL